jgi:hypothetical protein
VASTISTSSPHAASSLSSPTSPSPAGGPDSISLARVSGGLPCRKSASLLRFPPVKGKGDWKELIAWTMRAFGPASVSSSAPASDWTLQLCAPNAVAAVWEIGGNAIFESFSQMGRALDTNLLLNDGVKEGDTIQLYLGKRYQAFIRI